MYVADLDAVAKIFATSGSGFAVLDDASVVAWGKNDAKQFGDGTNANRTTPVAVDSLKGLRAWRAAPTSPWQHSTTAP